jgi:hypothetical protein
VTERDNSPEAVAAKDGITALAKYAEICAKEAWLKRPPEKRRDVATLNKLVMATLVGCLVQRLQLTRSETKMLAEAAALILHEYDNMKDVLNI